MAATAFTDDELHERLADLDRRLRTVESTLVPLRRPSIRRAAVDAPELDPPGPLQVAVPPSPRPEPAEPADRAARARAMARVGDLVGGRLLAWLGAAAMLLGIVLFLVLAVSRGWIGVEARVVTSGVASALLMAGGVWLHARRGRTEASVAVVAVATAGLYATLVVASRVYALLDSGWALAGALVVGGCAAVLAVRWAGVVLAAIGLVGALLAPILVGAPSDTATIAIVAVAAACATGVVVWQRWTWLGLVVLAFSAEQWAPWVSGGEPVVADLAVLAWFGTLGLLGGLGAARGPSEARPRLASALLLSLSALGVAVVGAEALRNSAGGYGGHLWLAALAVAYGAAGLAGPRFAAIPDAVRRLLFAIAVVLADCAFALSAHGVVLVAGSALAAVAFAGLARRSARSVDDRVLLELGLGGHVALALVRALLEAPPALLGSGGSDPVGLLAGAILAASCLTSAQLLSAESRYAKWALDGVGLVTVAYVTAVALSGVGVTVAWALEAGALAQLALRGRDRTAGGVRVAACGAAGFFALAVLHTLLVEAPPTALVIGVKSLPDAATALAVLASVAAITAWRWRPRGPWLLAGPALALLYLGSLAVITVFQPSGGDLGDTVLDLPVRQQGQMLVSLGWSLVGVAALVAGLRANRPRLRAGALTLLLLTVVKVFLYDLSTLTSLYRVVSFVALGVLLLVGAFAYQRLRPPPVPDMRSVHPSQR